MSPPLATSEPPLNTIRGYKTYILAAIGALVTIGRLLGLVNDETWEVLMGLLGVGTAAALRAGVKKAEGP